MNIISHTGGYVGTNGYIITDENHCIIVDAPAQISEIIADNNLKPTHLLLTHQHFDHTEDVEALQALGVKVCAHSPYAESLIRQKEARENWGIPVQITPFTPDILLTDENELKIGELTFTISHVPGHSPDSITYYSKELGNDGVVFVGDTLMAGSMGRTDLPGGSFEQLVSGIKEHLYSLPDSTIVLSGHGPQTSIGNEKEHNEHI